MCEYTVCIHVCIMPVCIVPMEARRGYHIWNWSYRWLWDAVWVLGTKPGSSGQASAFKPRAIFLAPSLWVWMPVMSQTIMVETCGGSKPSIHCHDVEERWDGTGSHSLRRDPHQVCGRIMKKSKVFPEMKKYIMFLESLQTIHPEENYREILQ